MMNNKMITIFGSVFTSYIDIACSTVNSNWNPINIYHRYKVEKIKKSLDKLLDDMSHMDRLTEVFIRDFMTFIINNRDFFPTPAFDYMSLQNEDILVVNMKDINYVSDNGNEYSLSDNELADQRVTITLNNRIEHIIVGIKVDGIIYKKEFTEKAVFPDNNINRKIFKALLSIILVATKAYVKGDYDAIEACFRTERAANDSFSETYPHLLG